MCGILCVCHFLRKAFINFHRIFKVTPNTELGLWQSKSMTFKIRMLTFLHCLSQPSLSKKKTLKYKLRRTGKKSPLLWGKMDKAYLWGYLEDSLVNPLHRPVDVYTAKVVRFYVYLKVACYQVCIWYWHLQANYVSLSKWPFRSMC